MRVPQIPGAGIRGPASRHDFAQPRCSKVAASLPAPAGLRGENTRSLICRGEYGAQATGVRTVPPDGKYGFRNSSDAVVIGKMVALNRRRRRWAGTGRRVALLTRAHPF